MVRSILIGVDGSPSSDNALELGIRWATRFDALLVGLGIVDAPTICRPEMVPIGGSYYKQYSDTARLGRARTQVEQFLETFALRCASAQVAFKLLEDVGLPSEEILLEAQRYDLILLGQQTHFHFATQQKPDGTLPTVLKSTPRPVVTVPERPSGGASVLVAYDGSLQAARALQAFQASGLSTLGTTHIVCVGSNFTDAARIADRAVEFLDFHAIKATRHIVNASGAVADAILNQARSLDAGLLVMGCYGQPTLREFFLGSVTRTVLSKATCPLFLYH